MSAKCLNYVSSPPKLLPPQQGAAHASSRGGVFKNPHERISLRARPGRSQGTWRRGKAVLPWASIIRKGKIPTQTPSQSTPTCRRGTGGSHRAPEVPQGPSLAGGVCSQAQDTRRTQSTRTLPGADLTGELSKTQQSRDVLPICFLVFLHVYFSLAKRFWGQLQAVEHVTHGRVPPCHAEDDLRETVRHKPPSVLFNERKIDALVSLQLRALLRGFHLRSSRKKIRRVGGLVGIHVLLPIFRGYKNLYKRKYPKHLCSCCVVGTTPPPSRYPSSSSFFPVFFYLAFPSILPPASYSLSPHKH